MLSTSALATDLEYAVEASFAVDWMQTRYIVQHPWIEHNGQVRYLMEGNPLLGQHPTAQKVNLYFPAMMAGHYAIDQRLSETGQRWFEGGTLAAELLCILRNRRIGANLSF